eukprot:TRINITY_DN1867_c0_g1_i1.p1 TRINITY_DN1867_c0_g1~~TRINITY_DN1867_c0_g1_i1.p1  ORF type:complete len:156 (-),score=9.82 TRINITY_DN1867_c0_g1_i1:674-1141(-)
MRWLYYAWPWHHFTAAPTKAKRKMSPAGTMDSCCNYGRQGDASPHTDARDHVSARKRPRDGDSVSLQGLHDLYLVQDMAVHAKGQPQSVFATVQPAAARPKYLLAIFRELATGKCMAPPDMPLPVLDTSRRHLVTATAPGVGGSGGSTGPSAQRP